MSSNKNYTLEELRQKRLDAERRAAEAEARLKRAAAKQRALEKRIAEQASIELEERLRRRGEMLESFIEHPETCTDQELTDLLQFAFQQEVVRFFMKELNPDFAFTNTNN